MKLGVAIVAGAVIAAGCNDAGPTAPSLTAGSNAGVNYTLSIGGVSTMSRGSRAQLRAFLIDGTGAQQEVTSQAVWSVGDLSVAVIENDGWITARGAGNTDVSARLGKAEGRLAISVNGASESPSTGPPASTPAPPSGTSPGSGNGSGTDPGSSPSPGDPGSSPTPPCLPPPLPNIPLPIPCPFPLPI